MPDLIYRNRQPEIMDDPALEERRHHEALRGLARINAWSGSARILWSALRPLALAAEQPVRVLDVATGSGDVPLAMWNRARREGVELVVHGCDLSPRAVACASERIAAAAAPLRFFVCDALTEALPRDYDVITCSLFLHHLDDEQAVALIMRMTQSARRMVLINDLVRSRPGYWLARLGTRLLSRCDVVHFDGPRSVEGAFTIDEVAALARRAEIEDFNIAPRWPCRFLMSWKSS